VQVGQRMPFGQPDAEQDPLDAPVLLGQHLAGMCRAMAPRQPLGPTPHQSSPRQ
jgi:hypothetical protein